MASLQNSTRGAPILVVDADPHRLHASASLLQGVGYRAIGAGTGDDGLRIARRRQPDIVLIEGALPDIDTLDLCHQIKATPELVYTHVILISNAGAALAGDVEGLEVGIDGFITRPISDRHLLTRVDALLRLQRMDRALRESEDRLHIVSELGSDWAYRSRVNPDGSVEVEWVTESFTHITGFDLDALSQSDRWADHVHPDDRDWFEARTEKVSSAQPDVSEYRIFTATGEMRWVRDCVHPVWDQAEGRVVKLYGGVQDITGQKQAEEELCRHAGTQALLCASASLIATLPDPEVLLPAALDLVLPHLRAEAGWVVLTGPTRHDPPRIPAYYGVSRAFVEAEMAAPLHDWTVCALPPANPSTKNNLPTNGGMQAEPMVLAHCPRLDREALATVGLHSHVGIPLSADGEVLGILVVAWRAAHPEVDRDRYMLLAVGQQIGVALAHGRLRQQAQEATVTEQKSRLARELHDSVAQSLYSLTLLSEGWRQLARSNRLEELDDPLAKVGTTAQQTLKDMRLMVYEMQPPILVEVGLLGALHQRLEAVENQAGVEARVVAEGAIELDGSVEEGLYRIAVEALNNSLKHASATAVTIQIRAKQGRVELEVIDNGSGFDVRELGQGRAIGIHSMRERAEGLGGELTVRSAPGAGTQVLVSVPTTAPR